MRGELSRAFLIGAQGEADEEMIFGFADVAAVDSAGRIDLQNSCVETRNDRPDAGDFSFAALRTEGGRGWPRVV